MQMYLHQIRHLVLTICEHYFANIQSLFCSSTVCISLKVRYQILTLFDVNLNWSLTVSDCTFRCSVLDCQIYVVVVFFLPKNIKSQSLTITCGISDVSNPLAVHLSIAKQRHVEIVTHLTYRVDPGLLNLSEMQQNGF